MANQNIELKTNLFEELSDDNSVTVAGGSITKGLVIEGVAAMTTMDIVELVSALEEKFGVSSAASLSN